GPTLIDKHRKEMKPATGRWLQFTPRPVGLAQKSRQIFVFPPACTPIPGKFAFATIEFFRMNAPAIPRKCFVWYHRVKHLVIQHVTQKPLRHEWLVQGRVNPDHSVFFLDCAKDELFPGAVLSPASPDHFVAAKALAKMPLV